MGGRHDYFMFFKGGERSSIWLRGEAGGGRGGGGGAALLLVLFSFTGVGV